MNRSVLNIEDLSICYSQNNYKKLAANNINLSIERGGSLGVIGESGSGKTSVAMCIMGLLNKKADISGSIYFDDIDLNRLTEKELNTLRWKRISIVFQNSLEILNPVLTIDEQITECVCRHMKLGKKDAHKKVLSLLGTVGLDPVWNSAYPHQLSGGMRQRVLLAMALSCDPEMLIVDEPTSSLDAVSKDEIISLIRKLHKEKKFTLIVVSHDMQTVKKLTSKVAVIYSGYVVEEGLTTDVINSPMHTYTRGLIQSSPDINPYRDLWGIPGEIGGRNRGCPFFNRCNQRIELCRTKMPKLEYKSIERKVACNRGGIVTLLSGRKINKSYKIRNTLIKACDNCNIEIRSGEVVVLLGQSGSGKSTLAGILSGTISKDSGEVIFDGESVNGNNATSVLNGIQIVFQDPFSATNELLSILKVVTEPLDILKYGTKEDRNKKAVKLLKEVQLPCDEEFLSRKCYTLSGGQRQRVALARSLMMDPKLLIADEISSMLDPSSQANILRLLKGLQNAKGFAMLYITHDIFLTRKIADKIYEMHKGNIVEMGMELSDNMNFSRKDSL